MMKRKSDSFLVLTFLNVVRQIKWGGKASSDGQTDIFKGKQNVKYLTSAAAFSCLVFTLVMRLGLASD